MEAGKISKTYKINFFTSNYGKFIEIKQVLAPYGIELIKINEKPKEIQSEKLEEIVEYCVAVARMKHPEPGFLEDTGLFIEGLNGFPGPYASFVFQKIGLKGILKLLKNKENRRSKFVTVIGYWDQQIKIKLFKGVVEGEITTKIRGKGWGYDPIFKPLKSDKTYGEMTTHEKNIFSHRGRAARKLAEWLREERNLKRGS